MKQSEILILTRRRKRKGGNRNGKEKEKQEKKMKLEINVSRKYAEYLARHLPKEHPKTKGKITLPKRRRK